MKKISSGVVRVILLAALFCMTGQVNAQSTGQQGDNPLEAALAQGPEAVVALLDTLRGAELDQAMDEIVAAHEQLALSAPPRPETQPVSAAEEGAILQAQLERDAANHAAALALHTDPALDQPQFPPTEQNQPADRPEAIALTVGSPPCLYSTVAEALNAASPGDTLLLEGGVTFYTNLSIQKNINLRGGFDGCGSGSTAITTLNGNASGRVMYIHGGLTVDLKNLNITNGSSTGNGAGIFVGDASTLTGNNLYIYNNVSTALGGGIRLLGASATFTNTNIDHNSALSGGGVHGEMINGHAPYLGLSSYADVFNNTIQSGGDGFGGGVFLKEGSLDLTNSSDIYSNEATEGGGVYLLSSTLTSTGEFSEIMYNKATGNGGGIFAFNSTINLNLDTELFHNQAGTSGTGSGGGAYLENSNLWSDRAQITYNTAASHGGGVYANNTSLLDMDPGGLPCTDTFCSQLSHNTTTVNYGGGVMAATNSEVDLSQTYVDSNTANYGGGIYATTSQVILYNVLMIRNDASGSVGDAIRLFNSSSLTARHNTLANNNAGGTATGHAINLLDSTVAMINSIIWGHSYSLDNAAQTIDYSDIQGGYTGTGNINQDPDFISPADLNFRIPRTSPAVDACPGVLMVDLDGNSRPIGAGHDMGAYEALIKVYIPLIRR